MATVGDTRIFPPIIQPYLPAKLITSISNGITIPFELNSLNDPDDIHTIHVSIIRQTNYQSLLNHNYPLGIIVLNYTPGMTAVTIPSTALTGDELDFNTYYKVQLRFSKLAGAAGGVGKTGQALSEILLNEANLAQFSEWSSVGAVRFIAEPTIIVTASTAAPITEDTEVINDIDSHYLSIYGTYTKTGSVQVLNHNFINANDNEYLNSWEIKIYNINNSLLMSSGVQTVNWRGAGINEFNYDVPMYFNTGQTYKLILTLTTSNLYTKTYEYKIRSTQEDNNWGSQSDIVEFTSIDSVIGKVNISFEPPSGETSVPLGGKLTVMRGSREDDFTKWDVLWTYNITNDTPITSEAPVFFDDFTIESGNLYKYAISYTKANNTSYSIIEGPIISVFDHAFLTKNGTQLCVKFNPNISNYRINVSDNMVTPIGSQFPYITRNGNMKYRTFSLSGTIAYEMDAEHQFATRSSIYGDWINVYGSYFVNRYINQQNDRITQREFREMVMEFLYEDAPKLFRSTPEGNILVRLTDISLTPKQELARMIYDFSCTATEIGDCSIENYKLYDII